MRQTRCLQKFCNIENLTTEQRLTKINRLDIHRKYNVTRYPLATPNVGYGKPHAINIRTVIIFLKMYKSHHFVHLCYQCCYVDAPYYFIQVDLNIIIFALDTHLHNKFGNKLI